VTSNAPKPPPTPDEIREFEEIMKQLSCDELKEWVESGKACTILDVRTDREWISHRIPSATHVPLNRLEERLDEVLALPGPLVVHCEHGMRSFDASLYLIWQGRRDVFNLTHGVAGYRGEMAHGPPERT
jgi:rhodanese-related sulfurtransferase